MKGKIMYIRKTVDEYLIQGHYVPYGWETLTTEDTRLAAKNQVKTYRENAPDTIYRIIKRRVQK